MPLHPEVYPFKSLEDFYPQTLCKYSSACLLENKQCVLLSTIHACQASNASQFPDSQIALSASAFAAVM